MNLAFTRRRQNAAKRASQGGFTLIELTVVFLVLVVLAVLAVPRVQGLILENKVPTVARELQQAGTRIRGTRASAGALPYAAPTAITLAELGALLRNTSFSLTGTPVTGITHGLGSGDVAAAVTVGAVDIGLGAGSAFTVLMAGVDRAACAPLATTMAGSVEAMGIGAAVDATFTGTVAGATTVKQVGQAFLAANAQTQCDLTPSTNIALVFR